MRKIQEKYRESEKMLEKKKFCLKRKRGERKKDFQNRGRSKRNRGK